MSGSPESKTCIQCGTTFPATNRHFHKSKDGFHARCRNCRNKREKESRKHKRNKKLDLIERGAVDLFVASAKIGGANIPHSSELLEVLMEYFGGVRGFANAYMKQYYDSPIGGAFRTKMLDSLVRLVTTNTAMGGAKKPLELMTEEELEAELRRQLMEAAMSMQPKVEVVDEVRNVPALGQAGLAPERGAVPAVSPVLPDPRDLCVPGDGGHGEVRGI